MRGRVIEGRHREGLGEFIRPLLAQVSRASRLVGEGCEGTCRLDRHGAGLLGEKKTSTDGLGFSLFGETTEILSVHDG